LTAFRGICAALLVAALGACAVIPDIPPDFALPVRAIVAQTSCELRDAFIALDTTPEFKRFKARQWQVSIALLPRTEVDLTASGGLTRRTLNNPLRFTTWALSGPGVQLDDKGIRSSGISYNFVSGKLMADRTLVCPPDYPSIHALAQHLGVGRWLFRSAETLSVASSLSVDKPVYNSEITIKLSANGSYTFTFPAGTNLASFAGSYSLDEQLNISMVPIPDKETLTVTSLPNSDQQYRKPVTSTVVVVSPEVRQDLQGIETAIRRLQTQ
jgi:hypothetical protein